MKPTLLLAGLAAYVAAAPMSPFISTGAKVEILTTRELGDISPLVIARNGASLGTPTDASSILGTINTVKTHATREDSLAMAAAAGSITLCSEHNKQGECKSFTLGTSGTCIRFDGMYMKAKSLLQPQGSACLYWSHDDCEEGGGPATALIDIYSFDGDQNWPTLFPYESLFASGKCYGSDQSLKAREFAVSQDIRGGNIG
jgi:hypothetical protein